MLYTRKEIKEAIDSSIASGLANHSQIWALKAIAMIMYNKMYKINPHQE